MSGQRITEQPSRIRRAGLGGRRLPSGPRPVRPGVVPVGVRPVQPARPATPPGARGSAALTLLSSKLGSSLGATLGSTLRGSVLRGSVLPAGSGPRGPVRRPERRVLARRAAVMSPIRVPRRKHGAVVMAALMAATATVVVVLGLLADEVAAARAGSPPVSAVAAVAAAPAVVAAGDPVAGAGSVTVGTEATVWEVAERVAPAASGPEVAALAERLVADNALRSVRVHPGQVLRVTAG